LAFFLGISGSSNWHLFCSIPRSLLDMRRTACFFSDGAAISLESVFTYLKLSSRSARDKSRQLNTGLVVHQKTFETARVYIEYFFTLLATAPVQFWRRRKHQNQWRKNEHRVESSINDRCVLFRFYYPVGFRTGADG
jgi:hypothetical protein